MTVNLAFFDRDDRRGLAANIATTVAIAVIANGTLALFGLARRPHQIWPAFAPPGPAIGAVWVVLFGAMGAARWSVARRRSPRAKSDARAIDALIAICLAYPFYTHAVGGHAIELAGNIVTFAVAITIAIRLRETVVAAACVGAVALWVAFATVLVGALVALNGWNA
jgi:tryptophan-rich sensory protein